MYLSEIKDTQASFFILFVQVAPKLQYCHRHMVAGKAEPSHQSPSKSTTTVGGAQVLTTHTSCVGRQVRPNLPNESFEKHCCHTRCASTCNPCAEPMWEGRGAGRQSIWAVCACVPHVWQCFLKDSSGEATTRPCYTQCRLMSHHRHMSLLHTGAMGDPCNNQHSPSGSCCC